jgi:hypothetical protein
MENILLVVNIDTHFVELSRLANFLCRLTNYRPIFWFRYSYRAIKRDTDICRASGWEFIAPPPNPKKIESIKKISVQGKIKKFIKHILLSKTILGKKYTWFRYFREIRLFKNIVKETALKTREIIENYRIALVVLAEDNIGYFTHIIVGCGKVLEIPTVIIPYTISNATEAAEYLYDYADFNSSSTLIHRIFAKKNPHWVYDYKGRSLLRLPPGAIQAIETSGFPCDQPWRLFNESSSIIAVENEHMLHYYRKEGLEENRLVLTGAIYDDILASSAKNTEENKKILIRDLCLDENKPILLCALPPDQFPRKCEFRDYKSVINEWMQVLASFRNWNVIVRPHPRQTQKEISSLESFGIKITTQETASLVPLCDLYVASVSATIRWAIACAKPVVNYDVYQMNYKDYREVKGVLNVFTNKNFAAILNRLTKDLQYYREIQKAQQLESPSWGMLDGKSSERIFRLFDDIIAGKYRGINQ